MVQILDFANPPGFSRFTAGAAAIAENDGVLIDNLDLGYSLQCTNAAAKGSTGDILAETTVSTTVPFTLSSVRPGQLQHSVTRDIYVLSGAGASTGVKIFQYNSAGLKKSLVLDSTATIAVDPQIGQLPNGNIIVSWLMANVITFMILDKNLGVVVALTTGETVISTITVALAMCVTDTGFAFTYVKTGTTTQRLVVYNQDASVQTAAFTIQTWTGGAGDVFSKIIQQSDGSLFVAFRSGYATTIGTYYGVFTKAGVTTLAVTRLNSTAAIGFVDLAALPGFTAMLSTIGTNNQVAVFSVAGVQQGTTILHGGTQGTTGTSRLLADTLNAQFILVDEVNGSGFIVISSVSTAAVRATLDGTMGTNGTNASFILDAMVDRGRIAVIYNSGSLQFAYGLYNTLTGTLDTPKTLFGTTSASFVATMPSIIPAGDFSFNAYYGDNDVGTPLQYQAIHWVKHTPTAIIGAAFTAIAANTKGYAKSGAGSLSTNQIGGQAVATFDHSAGTPHGNKGSVSFLGMSLVGMT